MKIFLLFIIPTVLIIIGMILNNLGLGFDQPASSSEQEPARRLEAERQAFRKFFDVQRRRFLNRQKRVGQYGWLVLAAFVVSFWWMYFDTVNQTTALKQIVAIQTLPTEKSKETVLRVSLIDGNHVKYLIKANNTEASDGSTTDGFSKEPVSDWELSQSGTAFSIGDSALPLGIALKISN
jgi:hypothetical protein